MEVGDNFSKHCILMMKLVHFGGVIILGVLYSILGSAACGTVKCTLTLHAANPRTRITKIKMRAHGNQELPSTFFVRQARVRCNPW